MAPFSEVRKQAVNHFAAIARDRLLQIAIIVQADIIMDLQIAVKYQAAVIDFHKLRVAADANRRSALDALDELKQRIFLQRNSLRTYSVDSNPSGDAHGSPTSRPASRKVSSDPFTEEQVLEAVSDPIAGDSQNGLSSLLVRYYYEQSRGRGASQAQKCCPAPDANAPKSNFRSPLLFLLNGFLREQALTMKDIDQIIAAYQEMRVEGDRADTLARLTGEEEQFKRDTLAVLQGNFGHPTQDTRVLDQTSPQLFKALPPLPKVEATHKPIRDHGVLGGTIDHRLNKWVEEQKQQPLPIVSRWSSTSAGSSAYSEHTLYSSNPPSLYYGDSRSSSRASGTDPTEPSSPINQRFSIRLNSARDAKTHKPFNTKKTPRNSSSLPSSRNPSPMRRTESRADSPMRLIPSRSLTPTFLSQRPGTPSSTTTWSRNASPEPRGRTRDHLHPADLIDTAHMLQLLRPGNGSTSQLSITPSVKSTITTAAQENMMNGRPCKDNNYWGFCKGAWATREDPTKGMVLTSRPEGMFSTSQVWQCRHCLFEGPACAVPHPSKKNKRDVTFDNRVHVSAAGIRYRWSFLAKSHVKKTGYSPAGRNGSGEDQVCNYGCVVCSVEGSVTGVYGSVEMLMEHLAQEHVYTGSMSGMTAGRSKVVVGRTAGSEEEWDVNIPSQNGLLF